MDREQKFNRHRGDREPLALRFWRKVQKRSRDECWLWTGSSSGGYGYVGEGGTGGRNLRAHRVSYELHFGPIPEGMLVCHTCDTSLCVNPRHLFLGTCQDNVDDRDEKGRTKLADARGSKNGRAKLVESDVRQILRELGSGMTQAGIAKRYGIDPSIISDIHRNKIWRNVPRVRLVRRRRHDA